MRKIKLIVLSGLFFAVFAQAQPILSILPSVTNVTLRTDGQTNVSYTVTNNTNQPINALRISPSYNTTGQASGISLGSTNTCTGTLSPSTTCHFDILIQGANQPTSFKVTPQVCGYNGLSCSVPVTANELTVNVNSVSSIPFAYFTVSSGSNANAVVPVNTSTLTLGTPVIPFASPYVLENPAAVSPDGTTVYVGNLDGDGNATLSVLSSGSTPILTTAVTLGYIPYFDVITVMPDGNTIYVAGSEDSVIHRVDKSDGTYTASVVTLPAGDSASDIAASPDGSRLFISSYAASQFYVMTADTNTVVQTLTNTGTTCEFDAPGSLAVTPDGSTIYVANGFGSEGISVVQKNNDNTYSCGTRITSVSDQLAGMILSSDGKYLYAVGIDTNKLYVFTTSNNALVNSYDIASGSTGVGITPDGSRLFLPGISSSYYFDLSDGLPTASTPTAINIGGRSQTTGNFVG